MFPINRFKCVSLDEIETLTHEPIHYLSGASSYKVNNPIMRAYSTDLPNLTQYFQRFQDKYMKLGVRASTYEFGGGINIQSIRIYLVAS